MLIVLEGIDGCGKTTLAETLAPILDAKIIHATRETPNDWEWFWSIIKNSTKQNIIADRFFWGQFAYQSPSERNITEDQLHQLEKMMRDYGGKIIYVQASWPTVSKRLAAREEQLSCSYMHLVNAYAELIHNSYCPVLIYDTEEMEMVDTSSWRIYGG